MADPTHIVAEAFVSEHVFLGGDEGEEQLEAKSPQTVRQRLSLNHRLHRHRTKLILYQEGFLRVWEEHRGQRGEAKLMDLRYLDSAPSRRPFPAQKTRRAALGLMGAGILFGLLGFFSIFSAFAYQAAAASMAAALVAAMIFLYRKHEQVIFYSTHGRAEVLNLLATFGSFRACRVLVPEISRAIEKSRETNPAEKMTYLRAEMREHYRLQKDGVISADACSSSTRRILAQFDR